MKTQHLKIVLLSLACTLLMSSAFNASAKNRNWRLNPDPEAKADFKSINEAMEDERVIPGDIPILDPGYYAGDSRVTKENITISGAGYFLSQNLDWADAQGAVINKLYPYEGCQINGCDIYSLSAASNISAYRCNIRDFGYSVRYATFDNVTVDGCFLPNGISLISFESSKFINNIFLGGITYWNNPVYNNNCIVEYNTIITSARDGLGYFSNSTIRNNIIINRNQEKASYVPMIIETNRNNQIINNVFSTPAEEANPNYPYNKYIGATVENTFVDEIIADRYYVREGSEAIKASGTNGQCGAFGGKTPYVISGILDNVPYITNVDIPAKPTDNSLKVTLKIAIRE